MCETGDRMCETGGSGEWGGQTRDSRERRGRPRRAGATADSMTLCTTMWRKKLEWRSRLFSPFDPSPAPSPTPIRPAPRTYKLEWTSRSLVQSRSPESSPPPEGRSPRPCPCAALAAALTLHTRTAQRSALPHMQYAHARRRLRGTHTTGPSGRDAVRARGEQADAHARPLRLAAAGSVPPGRHGR